MKRVKKIALNLDGIVTPGMFDDILKSIKKSRIGKHIFANWADDEAGFQLPEGLSDREQWPNLPDDLLPRTWEQLIEGMSEKLGLALRAHKACYVDGGLNRKRGHKDQIEDWVRRWLDDHPPQDPDVKTRKAMERVAKIVNQHSKGGVPTT